MLIYVNNHQKEVLFLFFFIQNVSLATGYSYLRAEMGSIFAAFLAGYQPKKIPVNAQTRKDITIAF